MPDKPKLAPVLKAADAEPRKLSSTARGYDARHRKLRALRLNAHPLCESCGKQWSTVAHHLVYPAKTVDDYRAVCSGCHNAIHGGR
jgi:hypothetical protein